MIQKLIFPLIFVLFASNIYAQVVINEISYNPPETNTDSLEFLEIFNAGNAMVNIGGWYFLEGIEDTFPDIDLQPGDYYVIALKAQAMLNVYGIVVDEWDGGALNNGENSWRWQMHKVMWLIAFDSKTQIPGLQNRTEMGHLLSWSIQL